MTTYLEPMFPTLAPCRDGLADLWAARGNLGEALGEKGLADGAWIWRSLDRIAQSYKQNGLPSTLARIR
jgi:hypothetical protein